MHSQNRQEHARRTRRARRWMGIVASSSLVLMALLPAAPASVASASAPAQDIPPAALAQIEALVADKESRTPAQQKIDSNLLLQARRVSGEPMTSAMAAATASIQTGVDFDTSNMTVVDITAYVSDAFVTRLRSLGADVIDVQEAFRSVRANVPVSAIETIAAWNDVIFIQPKQEAYTSGEDNAPRVASNFWQRVQRVRDYLPGAIAQFQGGDPVEPEQPVEPGASTSRVQSADIIPINRSEGDIAHRADVARATYGYTGAGVKVCVLSDGVNSLANLQASGDLPANVTVVPGQAGGGNEGAAMLEIVHDLAPAAQLFYATAFSGVTSFANNILTLRNTYHCDIIVDDVSYYVESPFQLGQAASVTSNTNGGLIAEAVNKVTADGALYFSSAGNSGNFNDGTGGVWEGDFVAAPSAPISVTGTVLDFDPSGGVANYDVVTEGGQGPVTLFWADPLGGSSNDYDVFVIGSNGLLKASSTNTQSGTQDPFELASPPASVGDKIVVRKKTGAADRYVHVNTNRGALTFATSGQTGGHGSAVNAFGVAAANANIPAVVFSSSTVVENFSSDGLRRHFFSSNGTPFTPGNFSSTGGVVTQKPDLTAADGVSCAAPGFAVFSGTSAAAPHAGAIAALLRSANPALTSAQVRTLLTTGPGVIDIEAPGTDRDSGAGVIDALGAMQALNPTAIAILTLSGVTVAEGALKNNNGVLERGETGNLFASLHNGTSAAATGVTLKLVPNGWPAGVKLISADTVALGPIAGGATISNTGAPFIISIAPTVNCGVVLKYSLVATYSGGGSNSPQTFEGSFAIGKPIVITTTLDTTAPPAVNGVSTSTTGTQTGRLTRDGNVPNCAAGKGFPGLNAASGARQYDAFTIANSTATTTCVTVTLIQTNTVPLMAVVYNNAGFAPANIDQNYLADVGTIAAPTTFAFQVGGNQSFTAVVHEVNPSGGIGQQYTLVISGEGVSPCAAPPPQPAGIIVSAGSGQSAPVNLPFATQLQATVRDGSNNPVPGVQVAFTAPGSGASGTFPNGNTAITDAQGRASVSFQANGTTGSYVVTANTTNPALGTAASFALTNSIQVTVSPDTLPNGALGQPYSQTLNAGAGLTFGLNAGTLPAGLSLSASGLISGTPTTAGAFGFNVAVFNGAALSASKAYTITIPPAVQLPVVVREQ